jgi:hypothetical protein
MGERLVRYGKRLLAVHGTYQLVTAILAMLTTWGFNGVWEQWISGQSSISRFLLLATFFLAVFAVLRPAVVYVFEKLAPVQVDIHVVSRHVYLRVINNQGAEEFSAKLEKVKPAMNPPWHLPHGLGWKPSGAAGVRIGKHDYEHVDLGKISRTTDGKACWKPAIVGHDDAMAIFEEPLEIFVRVVGMDSGRVRDIQVRLPFPGVGNRVEAYEAVDMATGAVHRQVNHFVEAGAGGVSVAAAQMVVKRGGNQAKREGDS